jgi:hypothetical protein
MRLGEQAKVLKDEIRRLLLLKTKFPRGMCFDGIKYIQTLNSITRYVLQNIQ